MSDKPTTKAGKALFKTGGGVTRAQPAPARVPVIRYTTPNSSLRALLAPERISPPRTLRLTTRLLEPKMGPSETTTPSREANRLLTTVAAGKGTSRSDPPLSEPYATVVSAAAVSSGPQLAPSAISDAASLGRVIRARRQILGLNQEQLSQAADVGRRFVVELEAGKPTIELDRALRVCLALGLSLTVHQTDG